MKVTVNFSELNNTFVPAFGETHDVSDGGYERGYARGMRSARVTDAPPDMQMDSAKDTP